MKNSVKSIVHLKRPMGRLEMHITGPVLECIDKNGIHKPARSFGAGRSQRIQLLLQIRSGLGGSGIHGSGYSTRPWTIRTSITEIFFVQEYYNTRDQSGEWHQSQS